MSWFNPWGEAAELRRELLQVRADLQREQRAATRLSEDLLSARFDRDEYAHRLRAAHSRVTYLEDRLSRAVFRDPKTGRLLPKGKVSL